MKHCSHPESLHLPTYAVDVWQQYFWHRPTDGRRYHAELKQNLFGQWTVVRSWGGVHRRQAHSMETLCQNYEEGVAQMTAVAKLRLQRGYVRADSQSSLDVPLP